MRTFGDWLLKAVGWLVAIGLSIVIPVVLDPAHAGAPWAGLIVLGWLLFGAWQGVRFTLSRGVVPRHITVSGVLLAGYGIGLCYWLVWRPIADGCFGFSCGPVERVVLSIASPLIVLARPWYLLAHNHDALPVLFSYGALATWAIWRRFDNNRQNPTVDS